MVCQLARPVFQPIHLRMRPKARNSYCNSSCASLLRRPPNSPRCFSYFSPSVKHFRVYSHMLLLYISLRFTDVLVDCVSCVSTHSALSSATVSRPSHVAALRHVKNPCSYRGSRDCKLNSLGHFSPIVLPFSARDLSRHLCAERAWRRQVRPKAGWYSQPVGCSAQCGETHRPYSKKKKKHLGLLDTVNMVAMIDFKVSFHR
jgi:hypothetical protein